MYESNVVICMDSMMYRPGLFFEFNVVQRPKMARYLCIDSTGAHEKLIEYTKFMLKLIVVNA